MLCMLSQVVFTSYRIYRQNVIKIIFITLQMLDIGGTTDGSLSFNTRHVVNKNRLRIAFWF